MGLTEVEKCCSIGYMSENNIQYNDTVEITDQFYRNALGLVRGYKVDYIEYPKGVLMFLVKIDNNETPIWLYHYQIRLHTKRRNRE